MRLSLGAWWPEGRSSSSVSQFLPTRFWSACPMAVRWKDGYRGDLSPWLFLQLCFCSVWGRCPAERGGQTLRCAQLSISGSLFESLIRLRSHTVRLWVWQPHSVTELTPVNFQDSQPHSRKTRTVWTEQDWTTGVCHVIQCKRELLCCTNTRLPYVVCFHVWFR